MRPGTVILVSGPADAPDHWQRMNLDLPGSEIVTPLSDDTGRPYAVAWIAAVARPLHTLELRGPLVMVGHGTAGPLLPALARTQRAAGNVIGGYVFVDASLPRPGSPSHLDLIRAADQDLADAAHTALHEPGHLWPPDAPRPRDHEFWAEKLPVAPDWPDAPCAYVHTGAGAPGTGPTDFWARSARSRDWAVWEDTMDTRLLAAVVDALPG